MHAGRIVFGRLELACGKRASAMRAAGPRRAAPIRLALVAALMLCYAALGAASPDGVVYEIVRHSLNGGGARSSSVTYALTGTIGQAEAQARMTGGPYQLQGGFWKAPAATADLQFSDGFE